LSEFELFSDTPLGRLYGGGHRGWTGSFATSGIAKR
jgi:hypothetical protein